MKKATIYKPTKSAMQSGLSNTKRWLLEFVSNDGKYIDHLMGWTGSRDMQQEIKLRFTSQEEAIDFAKKNKPTYEIIEANVKRLQPKSYADNFTH